MRRDIASSLKVNPKIPTNDKTIEFPAKKPRSPSQTCNQYQTNQIYIMTHNVYTRQVLTVLKLSQLKTIATQIGAEPADKRSKEAFISALDLFFITLF